MDHTALVTGSESQLACCLRMPETPAGWRGLYLSRSELDITDAARVNAALDEAAPDCIINTAAWTAVDRAESEPGRAHRINAKGVANLARWCAANNARLIHISTDFVFDGKAQTPYVPGAGTAPLGEYGASKLAGEGEVLKLPPGQGVVLRTSWLYSEFGANFVKTMLRLQAGRDGITVVNDQIGCPTSAHSLAALIWKMLDQPPAASLYHWRDSGEMSWYEFAMEIQRQGLAAGLLQREIAITPIAGADYPTAARRPAFSVMDRNKALEEYDMPTSDWRTELNRVVGAIADQEAGR